MDPNQPEIASQPAQTETYSANPMPNPSGTPVSPHKHKIISIVVVLVLLGLAAGAVFSQQKGAESTDQIFNKVADQLASVKFVRQKIDLSLTIKDDKIATQSGFPAGTYPKVTMDIDQVLPRENWDNPSIDAKSSAHMKLSLENFQEDSVAAEADFLMLKQMLFYIKLNTLTGVPVDTSSFTGKWWKVDMEALAKNFGGAEADKILESMKKGQLSKEKKDQLIALVKKYKNTARIEKLADGQIEGASAYRFSVALDEAQLANMLKETVDVLQKDLPEKEEIKASDMEPFFKMIDIKSIELLIGKNDHLPAQVKISVDMLDEAGKNIGTLDISFIISGSAPVEIKAPADSTDILYLMGPIVQSSLMSARQKGNEAAIKANLSSIRARAELFYDSHGYSYSGLCSSQEVKSVREAIENANGTGFVCKESAKKYAVGAKFPGNAGNWCVDSMGFSVSIKNPLSGTVCPAE
jgi:hypothetical protein